MYVTQYRTYKNRGCDISALNISKNISVTYEILTKINTTLLRR